MRVYSKITSLRTLIHDKTGARQNTLVVHLGVAVLLSLRRPLLHQLFGVQLRPVHLRPGKSTARTLDADGPLYDFKPWAGVHKPLTRPK